MAKIVELKDVTKVYKTGEREFRALDGVDLSIEKGKFVVFFDQELFFAFLQFFVKFGIAHLAGDGRITGFIDGKDCAAFGAFYFGHG